MIDSKSASASRRRPARFDAWFACAAICGWLLLAGCAGDDDLSSSEYGDFDGERRLCPGAYTPGSKVCWDPTKPTPSEEIVANTLDSEERMAALAGTNRCVAGLVGTPGVEGQLKATFLTHRLGGNYTPKNCGAVWIEDSLGMYTRTLEVWAGERIMAVVAWSLSRCATDPKLPDVITGATLPDHEAHEVTWDTRDFRGVVVPDGEYTLWMQVTENEIYPEGPSQAIKFTKGPTAQVLAPAPIKGFAEIKLEYTPGVTAAQEATAP